MDFMMNVKKLYNLKGKRRYSIKLFKKFNDMFNWMPIAALIDDKIFCVHGGISPELKSFQDIVNIASPTLIPDNGNITIFKLT